VHLKLAELFEYQEKLDLIILKEKGIDLSERGSEIKKKKVLALITELSELANEWRGFKYWSSNPEGKQERMLEEYVDCLHFILSLGIQEGVVEDLQTLYTEDMTTRGTVEITEKFKDTFKKVLLFDGLVSSPKTSFYYMIYDFLELGDALGFSGAEVEAQYKKKNGINESRQFNGY